LRRLPRATATLGTVLTAATPPSRVATTATTAPSGTTATATTATTCAGAATATASTPVPSGRLSEGSHGETREYDGGEGSQKQFAE
jgi:hypothetical protein